MFYTSNLKVKILEMKHKNQSCKNEIYKSAYLKVKVYQVKLDQRLFWSPQQSNIIINQLIDKL